ncbi:ADP-ribose pyrophosphatase, mitochondrial-like isoform X2 [Lineus longissimus]|uniref:ADP-ribose pyrophosphatase, mitochondrial-like isoform X2 n=1 Tax=Lineus longissimus TaxID=88925 RepID=UPI00315C53BF
MLETRKTLAQPQLTRVKTHGYMLAGTVRRVIQPVRMFSKKLMTAHMKCRNDPYPRNPDVKRFSVPEDKVPWSVEFPEYAPTDYTAPSVQRQPVWADYDVRDKSKCEGITYLWNELTEKVDRRSLTGPYEIADGLPRNPVGRTGMCSRGLLGRWGPNHAADPIVTRWKRNAKGEIVKKGDRPLLQFVSIQRTDTGEWALPGGMVDPGEMVSITLKREFGEEALNTLECSEEDKAKLEEKLHSFFKGGREVYRGYVDDPRNTDNSWMETIAVNFHDDTGNTVGLFKLHAGDDAKGVRWSDVSSTIKLYASHQDFIKKVAEMHAAHW